jgi:hypothetical protein
MAGNQGRTRGDGAPLEFVIDASAKGPGPRPRPEHLRRPGERSRLWRWLPTAILVAALVLAGFLGFLLRGLL